MQYMKKKNRKGPVSRKQGFTFVEMLIVSAILSVVALAIYAAFNNGIKIWQKVNQPLAEEDLDIFLDKFAADLRNTFKFTGIKFLGAKDWLGFPTLVSSLGLEKRTPGQVIYFYDAQTKTLSRKQKDFAQVYAEEEGTINQTLRNLRGLKFQYYVYDKDKKEYLWLEEWLREDLPLAVRIELEVIDGEKINKFSKTVGIPVSS